MSFPYISAFQGTKLAIKRGLDYTLLQWDAAHTKWEPHTVEGTYTRRPHLIPTAQALLHYKRCKRLSVTQQECLQQGTLFIPIVVPSTSFPRTYYTPQHTVVNPTYNPEVVLGLAMWNLVPTEHKPKPKTVSIKIPGHVIQLLTEDAVKRNEICPITLEPITSETSSMTSCFHMFDTAAIERSLTTNRNCPVCRHPNPTIVSCLRS